jgi:soluble lytic murein transglycosylase-like protein
MASSKVATNARCAGMQAMLGPCMLSAMIYTATIGQVLAGDAIYVAYDAIGVPHYSSERIDSTYRIVKPASVPITRANPVNDRQGADVETIKALVETSANQHRVPAALALAVARVESNFSPAARSPKGAIGIMQLLPETAARFGAKDIWDPQQNIDAGMKVLRSLLDLYDDNVALALAAYNAGEGAITRYGQRIPPFPETMIYVPNVMSRMVKNTSVQP